MTSLVEGFVAHLSDPSMDIRSKLNVATEVRDSVEINQVTADQESFATQLLPEIMRLLDQVPISMVAASPEHKLRHLLLDVLARLQLTESLKSQSKEIMDLVMRIAKTDNEENGVLCMKILTNLHRAFKQELSDYVQPFLDYVVQIIGNMPKMVHDLFDVPAQSAGTGETGGSNAAGAGGGTTDASPNPGNFSHTADASHATPQESTPQTPGRSDGQHSAAAPAQLFLATHSFKVLTECPIIIVLLFTSHRQVTQRCLPALVPHAIEVLNLEAAPQAKEHAAAASRGTFFAGIAPSLRQSVHRHSYNDFVTTQVKMMSFVSFIVRAFSPVIQRHLPMVPQFMIRLLKDCPPENSAARKELLVAMRHITNTEHRAFFLNKVHILLEERVLIGSGLTAYETLRPIAFSTVADLIHHLRNELSFDQIWQAVHVYTKNLLDMHFAAHYQGMCLKLLINVLDRLSTMQKPQEGRQIMLLVLKSCVDRLVLVNRQSMEVTKQMRDTNGILQIHTDVPNSGVKDAKFVFRGVLMFLRSLMFCLKASNPPPPIPQNNVPQWLDVARGFDANSVSVFRQLLREATKGLALYSDEGPAASLTPSSSALTPISAGSSASAAMSSPASPPTSLKENIDAIVAVFMQLDPATFNEIFESEMDDFIEWLLLDASHLHMSYLFTGNEATSTSFSTILLNHLMSKYLKEVGEPEHGELLLRLFKQCFSSINMFPATNEAVILPHLNNLIVKTLDLANDATLPSQHFSLLQHLFRTLGGGRFDNVYKLVLPLLFYLLETLNNRLIVARTPEERQIYAELCLTVPVRLSLMVPHLSYLMRPLATALNAVDYGNLELVAQGLRTLELCVDNLTAAYFDPHIEPVLPEILPALWKLLEPLPFDHKLSHTTLRILGKLGGRSRAHIKPPADLKGLSALDQDVKALIAVSDKDSKILPLRITPSIKVALRVLETPAQYTEEYHMHAFRIVSTILRKYIPSDTTDLSTRSVELNVRASRANAKEEVPVMREFPDSPLDCLEHDLSMELVEKLATGLYWSCQCESIRGEAQRLIRDIAEHLVLLELAEFNTERHRAWRPFKIENNEGALYVPPRTFVCATVTALSHENSAVSDMALAALRQMYVSGEVMCGEETEVFRRPMFRVMFSRISHACFSEPWYIKRGAIKGINVVVREMNPPRAWLNARALEITRTLFFVIKDSSPVGGYGSGNVPSVVSKDAADLLMYVLSQLSLDPEERAFTTFVGLLAFELESACRFGREVAQRALKYVAETTGKPLSEILSSVTEIFLRPIFVKPLRALPFPMQIGYSDCIGFCLSIPDTFLKFNDKLVRLLEEALALVDADDESLTSGQRLCEYTTAQQLTELRVVCIRLLARALTISDHLANNHPPLRSRIIALFFKIMSSDNQQAVDAAFDGMKMILEAYQKLPKDLLQAGLKPILLPLSDFKRLSVNVLKCLARMLEILTGNFKVEIGVKLLEHLVTLSEPARLFNLSTRVLTGEERIELGAALVNVFHVLPSTAHMFIPRVFPVVIAIESNLRRCQNSPFREPLAKFVERYPAESFWYFAAEITNAEFGALFADMVARAPHFAEYTHDHLEQLLARAVAPPASEEDQCQGICNVVRIAKQLPQNIPLPILNTFVSSVGDAARIAMSLNYASSLHLSMQMALEALQQLVLESHDPELPIETKAELVESMMSMLCSVDAQFSPSLIDFLWHAANADTQFWLDRGLTNAVEVAAHPRFKQTFLAILNAVLLAYAQKHGNLDDLVEGWLPKVYERVWQRADLLMPEEGSVGNPRGFGLGESTLDRYFVQLLQMSVLIVRHAPSKIVDVRKSVIKFGWRYITVEDAVSKLCAYVLVCYFVAAFDTFPKIVVQIYMALLKASQVDVRSLVQQALDALATVIDKRVSTPMWARSPRRILSEDGHGIFGVTNVCMFLARHAQLFYPYRDLYVPFVVSALGRLSFMNSQSLDVELAELLAAWESERYREGEDADGEGQNRYEVPHPMREAVVTYLVRFITTQPQKARDQTSSQRVLHSLDILLGLWPDTEVRLNFFDRILAQTDLEANSAAAAAAATGAATAPNSVPALNSSLDALHLVSLALKHQPPERIRELTEDVGHMLTQTLQSTLVPIQQALLPILERLLACDDEGYAVGLVSHACIEHLTNHPNHHVWVSLASVVMKSKPSCMDEHMALVIKGITRLIKDLCDKKKVEPSVLVEALELVASRISYLGDQRRPFLSNVAHAIERISDPSVSNCILDLVRTWVFGSEPFPTVKEKSAILYKLIAYTDRELVEKYYEIIVDVFESPKLRQTDLPTRLEQSFLIGLTSPIVSVRTRLMRILTDSVDRSITARLHYVIAEQSWEYIADKQWLCQALQLVLDPVKGDFDLDDHVGFAPLSVLNYIKEKEDAEVKNEDSENGAKDEKPDEDKMDVEKDEDEMQVDDVKNDDETGDDKSGDQETSEKPELREDNKDETLAGNLADLMERRRVFLSTPVSSYLASVKFLMFIDHDLVHETWRDVFPAVLRMFPEKERHELIKRLVTLMAKEYHLRQADVRPNVIQTLVSGVTAAQEQIPPQLAKYLSFNFDTWYDAIAICEDIMQHPQSSSPKVAEVNLDTLTELYAALGEDDHFYGLWRTRSRFPITAAALSYEQCGVWNRAMQLHETAQVRARSGVIPFSDSEYALWEDHWIYCAEKLQHWEILTDIAKHEGFTDLLLECQWRLSDWTTDRESLAATIRTVMDVPTPRRQVFETFLTLQGFALKADTLQHLSQTCDEGIQLALRKWHMLPARFTPAHAPLLHIFQQYVEFMEATQVYTSLQATTALNLEAKSQELKGVMQAWHDRLPNVWDDINWWGDLAAWRQQVFGVINRSYLPLISQLQAQGPAAQGGPSPNSSAAYRGYHEIAWTINRFAHTARKQNMPDVCVTQLSKIYTLPNIEIQEAFLKLREQAKCHLQNPDELITGLDVISNTNLAFFGNPQKAEFFALKGESLAKLGQKEHAYNVLSTAVQVDLHLPKAWAAWGEFNDRRFKEQSDDYTAGSAAVTCYLHAIGLYKNRKSRKLIGRLLWLIGLEDPSGQLAEAYEEYKGDVPVWYYVTYIPQLLTSLTDPQGKFTSGILEKIAKAFPQALHFHLRTARDEFTLMNRFKQRQELSRNSRLGKEANSSASAASNSPSSSTGATTSPVMSAPNTANSASSGGNAEADSSGNANNAASNATVGVDQKVAIEHTEKIMNVLKTAHPLLALSLETLIDQISQRFKATGDEDMYRLLIALLNDGITMYDRQQQPRKGQRLSPQTEAQVARFADTVGTEAVRARFKADIVASKPDLDTYIMKLRQWRDRFEKRLDTRPQKMNMEAVSPALSEFQYQKFEEVEIPGQNMELVDDNRFFTKIARFIPQVECIRGYSACARRITIQATDGSQHVFMIQYPSPRFARREERLSQVYKIMDSVMQRRTETRRRNLKFTLPNAIPLNMQIRMVQDDKHYVNFYSIYEQYCRKHNQSRDLPVDYTFEQLRASMDPSLPKPEMQSMKVEIFMDIQEKFVPPTIMRDYFTEQFRSFEEFWLFRKQFAYQYACVAFMTIMMSLNNRYPQKFMVNAKSGNVVTTDMQPIVMHATHTPTFLNGEPVAFRLTPNLQTLMGSTLIEGLLAPTMMVIGRSLSDPEFDLHQFLPLFVRDDILAYFVHQQNPISKYPAGISNEQMLQQTIKSNVDAIARRASSLGQQPHPNSTADQTTLDLISLAVNPRSLATTDTLWMPYF